MDSPETQRCSSWGSERARREICVVVNSSDMSLSSSSRREGSVQRAVTSELRSCEVRSSPSALMLREVREVWDVRAAWKARADGVAAT